MYLTDERYEEIKGEVVALFERCGYDKIPIDGFELARRMGIPVIPYSRFSSADRDRLSALCSDGVYFDCHGLEQIYYNDSKDPHRINMSLLHEIGHNVLDHDNSMGDKLVEAEAGFFAKYAAAPPPLVYQTDPESPEDIEEKFCLSREASQNAWNYYQKWLKRDLADYTEYEERLLKLFVPGKPRSVF